MRPKWTLAVGLSLALMVPAGAIAATPVATSKQDTAVAYYRSADESQCLIMTLSEGVYRPVGGEGWSYGQALVVQLASDCTEYASNSVGLDSSSYRIFGLTAAYVVASLSVGGHPVSVDIAWVATGTPHLSTDGREQHPDWSFVGKDVGAHLTGTVFVDGEAWTADQDSAILRSFAVVKNF
jgi:hypothetical protein